MSQMDLPELSLSTQSLMLKYKKPYPKWMRFLSVKYRSEYIIIFQINENMYFVKVVFGIFVSNSRIYVKDRLGTE